MKQSVYNVMIIIGLFGWMSVTRLVRAEFLRLVEFVTPNQADSACILPNMTRIDGRTLKITAPDMVSAYLSFRAAASMGR